MPDTLIAGLPVSEASRKPREDGALRLARMVRHDRTGDVLRMAGLRDLLHPNDAVALIYPSLGYFAGSARRERQENNNDAYGPYPVDGALLGIVDMRPQLRTLELELKAAHPESYMPGDGTTDPALPDGCSRRCGCHRDIWDPRVQAG